MGIRMKEAVSTMNTSTTLTAPDIVCNGCANAIQKALGALPGVADVAVDIDTKAVSVTHDAATDRAAIVAALDDAGFPVTDE